VNLEILSAELLARPLTEFTLHRNAKARELKASGRLELAGQVSALKKPSLPLWAVNRLAAHDRAMLDALRSRAQAVVRAQAAAVAGRPTAARDLRVASVEFQRNLEAAGNVLASALRAGGHPAGQESIRRIHEILRLAALQGGETWKRLDRGALTSEPRTGEDMFGVFGAGTGPAARKQAEREETRRALKQAERAARGDADRAQSAAAMARRLRQAATEMATAAKLAAERAKAAEAEAARAQTLARESQRVTRRAMAALKR
jgi:signal transduction histidine kinase